MPQPLDRRTFVRRSAAALLAAASMRFSAQGPGAAAGFGARRTAGAAGPNWLPRRELLEDVDRMLELGAVPGLALAIVEGGTAWSRGYGRADRATGAGVGGDTVFEAASLGKPVFAYGVLRLVEAGALELDRPLATYFALPEGNNPRMRRVTARHVLTHTSGLPNWRKEPGALEPATEPGREFSYSGEAFVVLQRVVEKVTGVPFARWMRETVLEPLGMRASSYVWSEALGAKLAMGHDETGEPFEVYGTIGRAAAKVAAQWGRPVEEWRYDEAIAAVPIIRPGWPRLPVLMMPNAAASFLTTADDYARFLQRVVAREGEPGLALGERLRREMTKRQHRLNSALGWGLGWGLQQDEHGSYLWHWGANMSFRNFAIAEPAAGRAVVVLTNGLNGPKVYERIVATVTGYDHPAFLWPYL